MKVIADGFNRLCEWVEHRRKNGYINLNLYSDKFAVAPSYIYECWVWDESGRRATHEWQKFLPNGQPCFLTTEVIK